MQGAEWSKLALLLLAKIICRILSGPPISKMKGMKKKKKQVSSSLGGKGELSWLIDYSLQVQGENKEREFR